MSSMTTSQKKRQQTSYFFDEMEEKMQAEDNKRRKLRKKPVNSQPELLFLQFDPNGKKDFSAFSNKSYSQPIKSNKKTSWQPPTKRSNACEKFEFSQEKLFGYRNSDNKILKQGKENRQNCIKSYNEAKTLNESKLNNYASFTVEETKPSKLLSNKDLSTLEKINCDEKAQDDNKENNFFHSSPLEEKTNIFTAACDRGGNSYADESIESSVGTSNSISHMSFQPRENLSNDNLDCKECPGISETLLDSNKVYECIEKYISREDRCNKEISVEYMSKQTHENKSQEERRPSNSQCDPKFVKLSNLEEIPAQCNPQLVRTSKVEASGVKSLEKYNLNTDYSDHEDIIHSIDLILSEDQSNNQDHAQEEIEDRGEGKVSQDEPTNKMLIDSVFENSSHSEDEYLEPHAHHTTGKKSISNPCSPEKQGENGMHASNCCSLEAKNTTSEVKEPQYKSSMDEKREEPKEEIPQKQLTLTPREKDCKTSRTEEKRALPQLEPISEKTKCSKEIEVGEEKNNHNKLAKGDVYNSPADDEYSCLMISTSQLLEIEKNYYEGSENKGPLNNASLLVNETEVKTDLSSSQRNFRKNISVGTQTETFETQNQAISTRQTVLPLIPKINWTQKKQETQRQLRESIQEIERLNTILLKVRQQIWPSRHAQESAAGPSNKGVAGTQAWKKK